MIPKIMEKLNRRTDDKGGACYTEPMEQSRNEPNVFLIGMGMAGAGSLGARARESIGRAALVIGSSRMVDAAEPLTRARTEKTHDTEKIVALVMDFLSLKPGRADESGTRPCCVLFSGDTGFFSGASALSNRLAQLGVEFELIPGISTFQAVAAKLRKHYENWNFVSLHAESRPFLPEIMAARETFILLGGKTTARDIIRELSRQLFSGTVTVVRDVCLPGERLHFVRMDGGMTEDGVPPDCPGSSTLCALLVENDGFIPRRAGAIGDGEFARAERVPMTKQLARSAIVSLLRPSDGETIWDVGSGTGAVSVDIARSCKCSLFSVERNQDALAVQILNKKKFNALNMTVVAGAAPDALGQLPAPDAVFVGGSGGRLRAIVDAVRGKNKAARILVAAVTLETLGACEAVARETGMEIDAAQVSVARTRVLAGRRLLGAENPVWLVRLGGGAGT